MCHLRFLLGEVWKVHTNPESHGGFHTKKVMKYVANFGWLNTWYHRFFVPCEVSMSSQHLQKKWSTTFHTFMSFIVYIYCNQEGACKQHLQLKSSLDACRHRKAPYVFFFSDLMSNEQECYTIKSPSCKEYKLPNALLIYGNSTRISYPNLTLIHWVCQSKRHTIAKDGTKTDHTINQDVEPNDLFTKISMTQIRSTIID